MKVLYLTHYSDLYGANLSMLGLAEDMLKKFDVEVIIICPKHGGVEEKAKEIGVKVKCFFYIFWQCERFVFARKILRALLNPLFLCQILHYVKKEKPDLIHSNSSVVDLGVLISCKMNTPCIWHLREFGQEDYNLKHLVPSEEIVNYYSKASTLVAVSDFLKEKYICKYPNLNICTIYNGVKKFDVQRKQHKGCNFCIVGKITEKKGHMDIMMAIHDLNIRKIDGFHVYIVGDGKNKFVKKLKQYLYENRIEGFVSFLGYSNNIEKTLSIMDVGIMASKCEAFGRVTIEYMYAGMSVIATKNGGTREILGNNCMYYESNNYKDLSLCMERCIKNPELVMKLGNVGKTIAQENYNQAKCSENVFNLYKNSLCK